MFVRTLSNASQAVGLATMLIKRFENPDAKPIEVKISEPQRSTKQNSLLHAIFQQCANKAEAILGRGNIFFKDASWWKSELKSKLGKKEVHFDLEDSPTVIIVSTADYTKPEMADFVTKIQAHMKQTYEVDIEIKDMLEELK